MKLLFVVSLFFGHLISVVGQGGVSTYSFYLDHSAIDLYENTFEVTANTSSEVIAISFVFTGRGVGVNKIFPTLITPSRTLEIPAFHEDPYHTDRFVSDLLYLSPAEFGMCTIKVDTDASINEEILVNARVFSSSISDTNTSYTDGSMGRTYDCTCPQPLHIPRTSWGLAFGLDGDIYIGPPTHTEVTHLIVHHSAGTNVSNNWSGVVASIFDLHVNVNGWQDIGYNWLVDPNGVIYEGRGGGDNIQGAHMCGYNSNTMAVCLLGNFVNTSPSPLALQALKKILAWKSCLENIEPDQSSGINSYTGFMMNISGHKDGCGPNYTACPGEFMYSKMDSVRSITVLETIACDNTSSLDENVGMPTMNIHPSPASEMIRIEVQHINDPFHIDIIDPLGMIVYTTSIADDWIDIGYLPKGMYLVKATNGQWSITKKIIKL